MIYLYISIILIFSAFFSGSEIAYTSSDKLRIELDRTRGGIISSILNFLYRSPDRFITTMLLGNNVALVIYGILMAYVFEPIFYSWVESDVVVLTLQSIFATVIILFAGEFIPKVMFRINPNLSMRLMAIPLVIIYCLLFPFTWIIGLLTKGVLLIMGKHGARNISKTFSTVDLEYYLESTQDDRRESEVKLIQNAISFPNLKARDCMTPRNEIIGVDIHDEKLVLESKFIHSGRSKLIVYSGNIDEPIGYIHSSEMFGGEEWNRRIVPAVFVPESISADKLMKLLILKKKSIAIVIDELGGTAGMVTLEDVIEEIFGDIEDEHDDPKRVARQLDERTWIFSGRMEIDDINEKFGLDIPEGEDFLTIAGYILHHHQSIPSNHEVIAIGDYKFEILRSSSTKIILVKVQVL